MKNLLVAFVLLFSFFFVEAASAKDISWSSSPSPALNYHWNWGRGDLYAGGWALGLDGALVTLHYFPQMRSAKGFLNDGDTVEVGTTIYLNAASHRDEHISWFGTGLSSDSPYGHWGTTEPPLTCSTGDYIANVWTCVRYFDDCDARENLNVYTPLVVAPPRITISQLGTAGLRCLDDSMCYVESPGTIVTRYTFHSTSGKFYYRYSRRRGCVANNTPMSASPPDPYNVVVPDIVGTISVTAVPPSNSPPTVPRITPHPFSGRTNTAYPFTFTSTDPDGDQILYEVDWNGDRLGDERTLLVPSGTSQSLANPLNQWSSEGMYTFWVRAIDSKDKSSGWNIGFVEISDSADGICGPAIAVPSGPSPDPRGLCMRGNATVPIQSGSNWVWGCNGFGGGMSTPPDACRTRIPTYVLTASIVSVDDITGTILDLTRTTTSINTSIRRDRESVLYNSSRTLRATPQAFASVSWSGCTSVSGNDCIISDITSNKTVIATFSGDPVDGTCGSADGGLFAVAPRVNLCSSGIADPPIPVLSGSSYVWQCMGLFGSGVSPFCDATHDSLVLSLCTEFGITPIATRTQTIARGNLFVNASEKLRAFYDDTPDDCAGTDVTHDAVTTWSEDVINPAFSLSVEGMFKKVTAGSIPGGRELIELRHGTGHIRVRYSIPAGCTPDCSNESNICDGVLFDASNCGVNNCTGTKDCRRLDWTESSP